MQINSKLLNRFKPIILVDEKMPRQQILPPVRAKNMIFRGHGKIYEYKEGRFIENPRIAVGLGDWITTVLGLHATRGSPSYPKCTNISVEEVREKVIEIRKKQLGEAIGHGASFVYQLGYWYAPIGNILVVEEESVELLIFSTEDSFEVFDENMFRLGEELVRHFGQFEAYYTIYKKAIPVETYKVIP